MKQVVTLLFFLLCPFWLMASKNQTIELEGAVSGTWNYDTVYVTGDIFLGPGHQLLIEASVYVEFQGFYGFYVEGESLQANGTPENPITFSVNDTIGLHNIFEPDGAWKGIFVFGQQDNNDPEGPVVSLQNCHIEFAKAPLSEPLHHGGGLYISGEGSYEIEGNTFFRNYAYFNGGGAYFTEAQPLFFNNHFLENFAGHPPTEEETYGYGGGLYGMHGRGEIRENIFFGNWASGMGGGLSLDSCNTHIVKNIFENNEAPLGGGLGVLRSEFIFPNSISGNLFVDNYALFFGGGIALLTFKGDLFNNTIVNNHAGYGGGLYCNAGAMPNIHSSIFWGNPAGSSPGDSQVFIWDTTSDPQFSYSVIEFGLDGIGGAGFDGELVECIEEDPLFVNQGDHPFQLQENSPAIVAGNPASGEFLLPETDLAGNPRFQNYRIDIGAYEYQGTVEYFANLTFVVLDEQNDTLQDAIITLNGTEYDPGVYVFEDLAAGHYDYKVNKEGYHEVTGELMLVEDVDLEVTLQEAAETYTVTFNVENEQGDILTDARITFDGNEHEAGVYVFENIDPGNYDYRVSKEGYDDASGEVVVENEDVVVGVVLFDPVSVNGVSSFALNIYPNPAGNRLYVDSKGAMIREIRIVDMGGQVVYQSTFEANTCRVDVSGFENGYYLLQVKTSEESITRRVLILP